LDLRLFNKGFLVGVREFIVYKNAFSNPAPDALRPEEFE
jgi:hypothetical protein